MSAEHKDQATEGFLLALERFESELRRFKSRQVPITIHDLEKLEKRIMATQAEVAVDLRTVTAQIAKIGTETSATLQKVIDLETIIKNGGNATQEVLDALAALKVQAQATDDLTPDAPAPTP